MQWIFIYFHEEELNMWHLNISRCLSNRFFISLNEPNFENVNCNDMYWECFDYLTNVFLTCLNELHVEEQTTCKENVLEHWNRMRYEWKGEKKSKQKQHAMKMFWHIEREWGTSEKDETKSQNLNLCGYFVLLCCLHTSRILFSIISQLVNCFPNNLIAQELCWRYK